MNINFPPVEEQFIKNKVEEGYYSNATEAVRDAVRQWRRGFNDNDNHARLKAALEEGEAAIRAGDVEEFTPELMQRLFEEGMQDAANGVRPDPDVCP